ncbi:MAG TPA: biotin--[acetyl-CoA-carboxylase] ligase [Dehalococcoidia bacterium]|nr:biotin--[acetyl-CoA-carboxylase] ligase [Dehalococcoidia bacterium]
MTGFDPATVQAALAGASLPWSVRFYPSVDSTMSVARALADAGVAAGTVVVADEQTAGRGRMGRGWVSPPGENLYFTILLRPTQAVLRRLAMIAPLAVAEGIEAQTGLRAEIKWPNDVQLRGLKCSGVLIDTELRGDGAALALVGIGIDVNQDVSGVPEIAGLATSLRLETGREVDRTALLAAVLQAFDRRYAEAAAGGNVAAAWKARLNTLGRSVTVSGVGLHEEGIVEDVDADGSLLLRRDDGALLTIPAGEVSLRPIAPPADR